MTKNHKLKGKPVDISVFCATEFQIHNSIPRFSKQRGPDDEYEREFSEDKGGIWRKQNRTETGKHLSDRSNSIENNNWRNLGNNLTEGTSTDWKNPIQDGKSTWRSQKSAGTDEVYRDNLTKDTYTGEGRNIHNKDVEYRRESSDDKGSSWRGKDMTETGKHLSDRGNSTENFNRRNLGNNLNEGTSTGWWNPTQNGRSTWRSQNSAGTDDVYRDNLTEDTNTSSVRNTHTEDVQYRRESTEDKGSWRRRGVTEGGKHFSDRNNSTETVNRRNLGNNLTEHTSNGQRNPFHHNKSEWRSPRSVRSNYAHRDNLTEDTDTRRGRNTHSKNVQYGRESPEDKGGMWKRGKEKGISDGSDSAECNSWRSLGKNLTEGTSIGEMDENLGRGHNFSGEVLGSRESSSKDKDTKEMVKPKKNVQACCKDPGNSIRNKSPGWGNGQNFRKSFTEDITEDTTSNNQKSNSWSSFCKDFPIKKDTVHKSNIAFSKDNHHRDKNHSISETNISTKKKVLEGNDSGEDCSNILLTEKNISKDNKDKNNPIEGSKANLTSGSLLPGDNPDRNKPKGDVQKSNQDQSNSCVEPSKKNYTYVEDTVTPKKDTATTTGKTNMSGNWQIRSAASLNQVISLKTERRVGAEGKEVPLHRNVIDHPKEGNETIKAELKPTALPAHKDTNILYNKNTSKNPRVPNYTRGEARDNWNVTEKYKGKGLCRAAASNYLSMRQKANNRFSLLQPEGD